MLESLASSSSIRKHVKDDDNDAVAVSVRLPMASSSPISFTMPTLVQHVQMSLRNPIGREKIVRSVRVLAEEVAPDWVGLKEIGRLLTVTIPGVGLKREELRRRAEDLMGKL